VQLFGDEILEPNGRATPFPFWEDLVNPEPVRHLDQVQTQWSNGDGSTLTLVARVEFVRDGLGRLRSVSGTVQDITEHDQTRRALAATTDLLQREQETATLLQGALLPKVLPEAPGLDLAAKYLPAGVGVGGDWYDASVQSDGRLLLAIGDVAGHGIAAATAMNEIRIACRAFSLNESSPSRILQKLNTYCRSTRRGDLVTALIVMLDPVTGEATLASAGHLPPVVAHEGRAEFVQMRVTPPLGVSVAHPDETSVVLEPGATLLLYTDGLVERRHRPIDERLSQLAELLHSCGDSAFDIVDKVMAGMLPAGPPSDDVALIAVKRSTDHTLSIRLPAENTYLAPIRALMRRWLAAQGATEEETQDIVLAVGELASNACTHASPMIVRMLTVDARLVDGEVHVTVGDQGRWRAPLDRGGGRGLAIARAAVQSLSIDSDEEGTRATIVRMLTSPRMEAEAG
jgi:anti-sigma regulatory factor (Ser/Thr protein kinase)